MYRGFRVEDENFFDNFLEYFEKGKSIYRQNSVTVSKKIASYLLDAETISAKAIAEDWFPEIDADIFISHSHNDEYEAVCLAGWIKENFDLKCFIDSCVWNFSDDLLNEIDRKYAFDKDKKVFDYSIRNYTTSNVYTILSASLLKMINKCEAFFLYGTPNSIRISDSVHKTNSPWIYSELLFSSFIKKQAPERIAMQIHKSQSSLPSAMNESIKFEYDIHINHLVSLNNIRLNNWKKKYSFNSQEHPLDCLYHLMDK